MGEAGECFRVQPKLRAASPSWAVSAFSSFSSSMEKVDDCTARRGLPASLRSHQHSAVATALPASPKESAEQSDLEAEACLKESTNS